MAFRDILLMAFRDISSDMCQNFLVSFNFCDNVLTVEA